jgi:hypothetical protein
MGTFVNVTGDPDDGPYACPCCRNITLPERGGYDICVVCGWEDDGQDDHDADVVRGGPNGSHSLTAYRQWFAEYVAEQFRQGTERDVEPDEQPFEARSRGWWRFGFLRQRSS